MQRSRFDVCVRFAVCYLFFIIVNVLLSLNIFFSYTGEVISDKDRCPQCKGNKVTQEKKVLDVHVEKGMQHSQKIVFQGEADEAVSMLSLYLFYFMGVIIFLAHCCSGIIFGLMSRS